MAEWVSKNDYIIYSGITDVYHNLNILCDMKYNKLKKYFILFISFYPKKFIYFCCFLAKHLKNGIDFQIELIACLYVMYIHKSKIIEELIVMVTYVYCIKKR